VYEVDAAMPLRNAQSAFVSTEIQEQTLGESWDPQPDRRAAEALSAALARLGYGEESVEELLGEDGVSAGPEDVAVFSRRLPATPLGTALRLLLLQLPVDEAESSVALGREAVDALLTLGLVVAADGRLVPRSRIMPVEGLLISFDGFSGRDDPHGYVSTFSPTTAWLAALTPRRRVANAVDIGTGNGAHALLAARHSDRVVATDLNQRALAYTEINAALNGLDNVEVRHGSLFEPVAGEKFDLVLCNAPFVVSPESRWQYRDSGMPADQMSELVVRQAALALNDDGYASVLVSWVAQTKDEPDDRVLAWVEGSGCDAWILGMSGADPLDHAFSWNNHLVDDQEALGAALDDWSAYFRSIDVGWITEGAVLLHRRSGSEHAIRVDPIEEDDLEDAGPQIERAFAAHAYLSTIRSDEALLDGAFELVEDVRLDRSFDADGGEAATVVLHEGTMPELEVNPETADVLASLDGNVTLGRAIERVTKRLELTRRSASELRREAVDAVRELLELGFIDLR
jgi:methylase of polypeptide subunit release factors